MMRSLLTMVWAVLALSAPVAGATDLLDVWRAALQHDLEISADRRSLTRPARHGADKANRCGARRFNSRELADA